MGATETSVLVSKDGIVAVATDGSIVNSNGLYTVLLSDGRKISGEFVEEVSDKPTTLLKLTFTEEDGVIPGSIKYGDINRLKLGQTILTLYGRTRTSIALGIISGLDEEEVTTFVQYFNQLSDVQPDFKGEKIPPTTGGEIAAGRKLFKAFQCIKCHKSDPEPGLSASFLAPDLVIAKDRLRADWIMDWLVDPQALEPGTMMPAFFPDGETPLADVLEGDYLKQSKAIRDYLLVFTPEEAAMTQGGS